MKKSLQGFSLAIMAMCIMNANAQPGNADWGTNKFIATLSQKCAVSLAENGYIYLLHQYNTSFTSDLNGWVLYRSTDFGQSFNQWVHVDYDIDDYKLKDAALVVTGTDAGNIKVFIAELLNTGNSGVKDGYCRMHMVSGSGTQVIYSFNYGHDPAYSISLASDSRAPGGDASPFAVAMAWTGYNSPMQIDELHLVYSLNGGDDFTHRNMYEYPGLNRVSLSLGGNSLLDIGYYAIAFETNYDAGSGLGDIGLFLGRISSFAVAWTDPVIINQKYAYLAGKVSRPAVCLMQDQTDFVPGSNFVPLLIAMEDHSAGGNSDLAIMRFNNSYQFTGFNPEIPAMAQIEIKYPYGSGSSMHEKNPYMIYDREYNHFLMTFSTANSEELYYAGINTANLLVDEWWSMGNYRSNTGDLPDDPMPHVDIDLSQGKAVFSWKDNYLSLISPAKSYFDTEWWVVGMQETGETTGIAIFPNPASDMLTIRLDDASGFSYWLNNIQGKTILSGNSNQQEVSIMLPHSLETGVYLIKIITGGKAYINKVIIQ